MPRLAAVLLLLLSLAACGPASLESDVTRFTTLPADGGARSFTILPGRGQRGSLEFQHYAELVADQLARRAWQPRPAGGDAAAVVVLRWGLGPPATTVRDESPSMWGGGPGPWTGGLAFSTPAVSTSTVWPTWLEVEVVDGPAWRAGDTRMIWQGRAVAAAGRPDVAVTMPTLVRALFTDFPGRNGATVRIRLPVEQ